LFGYKGTLLAAGTTQQRNNSGTQSVLGTQGAASAPAATPGSGASSAANKATGLGAQALDLLLHRGSGGGSGGGKGGGLGSGSGAPPPTCQTTAPDTDPMSTGCTWLRLADDLQPVAAVASSVKDTDLANLNKLTLSAEVEGKWVKGDQIVITTTDYLPGHS